MWCGSCCVLISMVIVALVGLIMLITFGVINVRPYNLSLGYTETNCTIIPNSFNKTWAARYPATYVDCTRSEYPCMKINVYVMVPGEEKFEARFYQYDREMSYQECSLTVPCVYSKDVNTARAKQYLEELYANIDPFPCFYDPSKGKKSDVFKERKWGLAFVVITMLVSTVILVVGLIGITMSVYSRQKEGECL